MSAIGVESDAEDTVVPEVEREIIAEAAVLIYTKTSLIRTIKMIAKTGKRIRRFRTCIAQNDHVCNISSFQLQ